MISFGNYEVHKMAIYHPEMINFVIIFILILICLFSLRKGKTAFLDKTHTDQVKGLAIVFIIITHLWFHVSQRSPELILGPEFFALFLILSGFGLSQSTLTSRPTFKQFLAKRIHRIYVPYWVITIIILVLDCIILNRTYSTKDIVLTFLGINISRATQGIDYARWFITFLLFWYGIFFISTKFNNRFNRVLFLFLTAFVFFFFDYYVTRLEWHQIFSFPFGVFLAYYYKEITKYLQTVQKLKFYNLVPIVGLSVGVIYELYFRNYYKACISRNYQ